MIVCISWVIVYPPPMRTTRVDIHIFTDSLNTIFSINNYIRHPTSQHHHPCKLIIAIIVHHIYWTLSIHIHKVRAHSSIIGNEIANTLANEGTLKDKPHNTPHIHIAHRTPYWLANCPTVTDDGALCNLRTTIWKEHGNREAAIAKNKFPHIDKWLSSDQINHKLSNHFWKNEKVIHAQISQTLKFRYARYMGNHRKTIFWPSVHQNPNCTLCHINNRDSWPHLLALCEHPFLKGLRISKHDKAVHLITQTLQANKYTRFFTLTNAGKPITNLPTKQSQTGYSIVYAHKLLANVMPKLDRTSYA